MARKVRNREQHTLGVEAKDWGRIVDEKKGRLRERVELAIDEEMVSFPSGSTAVTERSSLTSQAVLLFQPTNSTFL